MFLPVQTDILESGLLVNRKLPSLFIIDTIDAVLYVLYVYMHKLVG